MAEKKKSKNHPEVKGLLLLSITFALLLSLLTFSPLEPSSNWLGLMGHWLAFVQHYLLGLISYPALMFTAWVGWKLLCGQKIEEISSKIFYFSLFCVSSALLLNLIAEHLSYLPPFLQSQVYVESSFFQLPYPHRQVRYNLGGVPLYFLYRDLPTFNLQRLLSDVGIGLTFSITAFVSFLLVNRSGASHRLAKEPSSRGKTGRAYKAAHASKR